MNGRQHQQTELVDDQRPSRSSTASSDKSAAAYSGRQSESGRRWRATGGDDDGDGEGSPARRAATFRSLLVKHWHAAVTYCAVFWSFGMCVAFLGPTLLDLGCITSSDMRAVSWVFLAQLLCSLLGASAASYLVKR